METSLLLLRHPLPGRAPTQLQKDAKMREIIWRNYAQVSDRLADILDKMVRYHQERKVSLSGRGSSGIAASIK